MTVRVAYRSVVHATTPGSWNQRSMTAAVQVASTIASLYCMNLRQSTMDEFLDI